MSVVLEANGTASGYVLTFADVSARDHYPLGDAVWQGPLLKAL